MASPSRRQFLATSAVVAGAACSAQGAAIDAEQPRQYYEWRTYRLGSDSQPARVLAHLESAALPAWKRLGVGPVGVFTEIGDAATSNVHVLLAFAASDDFLRERTGLENDVAYAQAAQRYLTTAKQDPAFARIESTLMIAFEGHPLLTAPQRRPRVLELRTYQSHSEAKARRKIEMFNDGEIPIFRDAGFEPVFFGESLYGGNLPNLQYALASDDMEAHNEGWKAFRNHPDWIAMKDLPKYADTVSHIDQLFLAPTAFSEV